ncbi:hypothetical protein JTE90_012974 [Oedothorax gibbosus]|uniref:Uncharacterized protein n=1 Tax=Oedothorax gibbosus TaxID=931172 RepID=A0AAV6U922_9ARAC|nr:hypothetical protein JTE90_012974 [Oedothorax gibbosus]
MVEKTYGDCWQKALADLRTGCKQLNEETQSRLALSFANCFLEHSGTKNCPCSAETPISHCLKNVSDRIFVTYTKFFTHTQSICHYLQHREWQREAEESVFRLTETSISVSRKLDQASQTQDKILDTTTKALSQSQALISNGQTLHSELEKSRNFAKTIFAEFKSTTQDQRLLVFEVFDRIKSLQNFVLGEFTSVYTFVYYGVGVFLIYVLTSVPKTAEARLCLLLMVLMNAAIERMLVTCSLDEEMMKMFPLDANGPMYSRIWICRKIFCFFEILVLMYHYYRYKDYNSINNRLLQEIKQQNSDLQLLIQNAKLPQLPFPPISSSQITTSVSPITSSVPKSSPPKTQNTSKVSSDLDIKSSSRESESKNLVDIPVKVKPSTEVTPMASPNQRYNLRSRVNSPAQSPYNSPLPSKDLADGVAKSFQTRPLASPRI